MECPYCSFDNIEGVDQCACCRADLTDPGHIEERRSPLERELLHRPLGSLTRREFVTVQADMSVRDTVTLLKESRVPCAMVLEGESVVGIFTERDLLMKAADGKGGALDRPVRDLMTPGPTVLRSGDPVVFGLNRMMVGDHRHIPVVDEGKLAGVVSVRHMLDFLVGLLDQPQPSASAS